jgi:hypothetical protein
MSIHLETSQTKPFGPAAAAFLAAGFGTLVLGVLTTWAEVSADFGKAITYSKEVGPLSGKVILTSVIYVAALAVLGGVFWRRNPSPTIVYWAAGILVAFGLILTFPPTWKLFGAG